MRREIYRLRFTVSLPKFVGYFLWLGTVGISGPIALAGHMQQDLVDERGWVSKQDYLEGLALAQLAPGPLAAQLAIYLGYLRAGILGATAVGIAYSKIAVCSFLHGAAEDVLLATVAACGGRKHWNRIF
jgi:chromate transport protein ChrA